MTWAWPIGSDEQQGRTRRADRIEKATRHIGTIEDEQQDRRYVHRGDVVG
jgi:hypothetical protein